MPCTDDTSLLTGNCDVKAEKTEGWNELDSLGEQLLRQSLPGHARRGDGFNRYGTTVDNDSYGAEIRASVGGLLITTTH